MFSIRGIVISFIMAIAVSVSAKKPEICFVHTEGMKLVDEKGAELFLRGMGFGNDVWTGRDDPPAGHHQEKDYEYLKMLGFNSVRFYLNYQLFESDRAPYVYKKSGFDWIEKNVEWAKKHGIYLILNMHIPQGDSNQTAEDIRFGLMQKIRKGL